MNKKGRTCRKWEDIVKKKTGKKGLKLNVNSVE